MAGEAEPLPIREYRIPAERVRSLCWVGDDLVDFAAGQVRYGLDGQVQRAEVNYAYPFNAAVVSPSGRHAALYQRFGTKGILIDVSSKQIIRELNRSFYHAHVYDYPITIFTLPDGREILAHCPDEYCKIELEELESGRQLTRRDSKPIDFFHSRLAATADGKRLLSAGWIWHPVDSVCLFDVEQVVAEPARFDANDAIPALPCEVNTASFVGSDSLLLATWTDAEVFDEEDPNPAMGPANLCTYCPASRQLVSRAVIEEPVGEMMPVGSDFVVGFYDHPKVFDVTTGKVVKRWPDLPSGTRNSSIEISHDHSPVVALDAAHRRFAVVCDGEIVVVEFLDNG